MAERKPHRYLFAVLLLAGAAIRIFSAWCYRDVLNPDAGVVALMARHMAELRDFPVFFYGQAYMGSLEAGLSAIFCGLLGCSGFAVCLGTGVVAFLLLPVIYAWASDAGGRKAGLAAMAFCLIGTGGYFHYMGSPRGGYAAVLLFETLVLWLGTRIIIDEYHGRRRRWGWFFLLGVCGGLGWWCNQLILPALLTVVVVFLLMLRSRTFTWRLAAGAAGFLVGSLPFWVWNAVNDWATFDFLHSFGKIRFQLGLELLFGERLSEVLDIHILRPPWKILALALYAGAALVVLVGEVIRSRQRDRSHRFHILSILVFLNIFVVIFSASHFARFNTPRYLLPLLPAVAVIVGLATARLTQWLPYGLGWLPLLLLVASQYSVVMPGVYLEAKEYDQRMRDLAEVGDLLRKHNVDIVYGAYGLYSRNFLLDEEFCFTGVRGDRYPPYSRRAEMGENVAVEEGCDSVEEFLAFAGGSAQTAELHGLSLLYDFKSPNVSMQVISPEMWEDALTTHDESILSQVTDGSVGTFFLHESQGSDEMITVRFREPVDVCAVRLVNRTDGAFYPAICGVQGREKSTAPWRTIRPPTVLTGYYWSGSRPYWGGIHQRYVCRFAATTLSEVRLVLPHTDAVPTWRISELEVLGPGPELEPEATALTGLLELLGARLIDHLYSDRWIANMVDQNTSGAVLTEQEPHTRPRAGADRPNVVMLSPHTGLLTRQENVSRCRRVLAGRRVAMRETAVGPWILFDFGPGQWRDEYRDDLGIYWAGFGCLFYNKPWSATLVARAEAAYSRDMMAPQAKLLFLEALARNPNCKYAVDMLAAICRDRGNKEKAAEWEAWRSRAWEPEVATEIGFENGIRLLGVSLSSRTVRPGERLTVRYYWQSPPEIQNTLLAVFVHIKGRDLFQDDHVLLEHFDISYQARPEVFVEEREVLVPGDVRAGTYHLWMGLYDRTPDGDRVPVETTLPMDSDAVRMPVEIEVVPGA